MDSNLTNTPDYTFISKNSQYLDPKHRKLVRQSFEQEQSVRSYYTFQSKIYDATRWSFLFGRKRLLQHLPYSVSNSFSILEVGCGTGTNLQRIGKIYPKANLMGIDLSKKMLLHTKKKLKQNDQKATLLHTPYDEKSSSALPQRPQVILFSYALTMVNPHWKQLILQAKKDLTAIGYIAVVDFHNSPFRWFRNHMQGHHVRMDGHLLPFLRDNFEPIHESIDKAYLGLWQYFSFIGKLVD